MTRSFEDAFVRVDGTYEVLHFGGDERGLVLNIVGVMLWNNGWMCAFSVYVNSRGVV